MGFFTIRNTVTGHLCNLWISSLFETVYTSLILCVGRSNIGLLDGETYVEIDLLRDLTHILVIYIYISINPSYSMEKAKSVDVASTPVAEQGVLDYITWIHDVTYAWHLSATSLLQLAEYYACTNCKAETRIT